jgi:hypothetical protein
MQNDFGFFFFLNSSVYKMRAHNSLVVSICMLRRYTSWFNPVVLYYK